MRLYLRAMSYFRQDVGQIVLSLTLIGVYTLVGLLQPFPLAILLDSVLGHQSSHQWVYRAFFAVAGHASPLGQIMLLAVAMLAVRLTVEVSRMIQTLINIRIGYAGLLRVRCDLFRKLQALSLSYHQSQPQGDAIFRLSWDTFSFQSMLNVSALMLVNVATLVFMICTMLAMDWRLTLVALGVVPPLVLTIKAYAKVFSERSMATKEIDSKLTTAIQRSVSSMGLVQAFGREADEYDRFQATAQTSVNTWLKLHWQEVMYWLIIGVILGVGGAAMFGYGAYRVYQGRLAVGQFTIFLAYLWMLYDPLSRLSGSGSVIQSAGAGVLRVFEVLDRDPVIRDAPDAASMPRQPRVLEFENVGFEYRDGEPVLADISAKISPGDTVAFVGSSGTGKTTLLNLLPRFYDPTHGCLRLDGCDIRTIKIRDLRRHIALVVQENAILPGTVAENIAYGRPDAKPAQIAAAAAAAGAAEFIDKLPHKYDTQISESGQNLSGGQRQRIAIARALLTEAPILVLDEPTSALDADNERLITETLGSLKGQRTIILVSHRLSTVAACDQILVMDGGRIVESGTHEQLVQRRGAYFRMAQHQMKLGEPAKV